MKKVLDKARLRDDFIYFTEECLGYKLSAFHKKIIPQVMDIENRYICIIWPTGHLKTTVFSKAYPIWRLYREENFEICRFASSIPQSRRTLIEVRRILETNKYLKHLVKKDEKWNQSELFTTNNNQYYITPFSDTTRGIHVDLLIGDDILRDTDISPEKIKDIFWNVFYPRVQSKKGQVILVGTPLAPNDLLMEIQAKSKYKDWVRAKESAVVINEKGEWIEPIWPENFSLEELIKIKDSMGSWRFAREYMCNPESSGTRPFPQELLLECCDDNLAFMLQTEGHVYLGVDLAESGTKWGDYSVFTIADVISGNYTKIIEEDGKKKEIRIKNPVIIKKIERYKGMNTELQKERIKFLANTYSAKVVIDITQFGSAIANELRSDFITVQGEDFASRNRREMINNLRRLFESKRIVIPTSDKEGTYDKTKILLQELSKMIVTETPAKNITYQVESGHDDCIMSLALAIKNALTQRPVLQNRIFKPE